MKIQIINLVKKYKRKCVLNDINLSISKGVYGILGENGAGKTTLIKCLCGLTGYIGTINYDVKKNKIGYLPQEYELFENLSVEDNVEFFNSYYDKDNLKCEMLIKTVGLENNRKTKAKELSGGMKRRLGLAIALLNNPEVIILDEPTAGLDPAECIHFRNLINSIKENKIVIITSHIIQDIESMCDKIVVLDKGKIIFNNESKKLAEVADGKIYLIDKNEIIDKGLEDNIIETRVDYGNKAKIISNENLEYETIRPTIEDGYLCLLKEHQKESV
jgi:ABC-2 type transport system ATP-binding protein